MIGMSGATHRFGDEQDFCERVKHLTGGAPMAARRIRADVFWALPAVTVSYTGHDGLVHAVTLSCQRLPVAGLVIAPGLTGTGSLAGTWTVVHAASGLVINHPAGVPDLEPGFRGHFDTRIGAEGFASSLAGYFPDVDFTAGAETVGEALRRDRFAFDAALHAAFEGDRGALADGLAVYDGVGVDQLYPAWEAAVTERDRYALAWRSAVRGRREARGMQATLARSLIYLSRALRRYRRAVQGQFPYWQHACGHIEAFTAEQLAEIGGGCDACESGSPDPAGWRPLYTRAGLGEDTTR